MEYFNSLIKATQSDSTIRRFALLYGRKSAVIAGQLERYSRLIRAYAERFGESGELRFFSAPGRTEIGGNHTDHNRGQVLAAAITLDIVAAVTKTGDGTITLYSEGFDEPFALNVNDTAKRDSEHDTIKLTRGIVERMKQLGLPVGGFNAVVTSNVLVGSGLSSSACYEVLICAILDGLYGGMSLDPVNRALICQWAENNYMNKPCGLMDQTASSRGGIVNIDFAGEEPVIRAMDVDFSRYGYSLAVVNTGSSHGDLTNAYASIPAEMRAVAAALGGSVMRDISRENVLESISTLRRNVSDRAILRALHFLDENERVGNMVDALGKGNIPAFFESIIASGESSWKLLQNIYVGSDANEPLALALELSRRMLHGQGAWRVHGGGFAGTILAFVPDHLLPDYSAAMDTAFGKGACVALDIRAEGAVEVIMSEE